MQPVAVLQEPPAPHVMEVPVPEYPVAHDDVRVAPYVVPEPEKV